jgi:filamentous hemagglutinin family protein
MQSNWQLNTIFSYIKKVSVLFCMVFTYSPVTAEVVSDQTLPSNSQVINQNRTYLINGGTQAGNNLFHSFDKFSVPTDSTAFFNNGANIKNIISRVTGSSITDIDGLIKANGIANLLVINPNGIIFGQNAQLEIGGSFIGSTGNSINFADGILFSAKNPDPKTLLSVNIPIGLQYGDNPGAIKVQGTGHTQFVLGNQAAASIALLGPGESPNGLRLQPGKTLALVGGEVLLNGGVITAPSGRIEIGSVNSTTVNLIPILSGWSFSYEGGNKFNDINLTKQSLLDASGTKFGDIHVKGKNINFTDGSLALIVNFGSLDSGAIRIDASNTFNLTGITSFNATLPFLSPIRLNRGIVTATYLGKGADIIISSNKLVGRGSAIIDPLTFGSGNSGNLIINSSNSVEILGQASNETSGISSSFQTVTYSSGRAGDVNLLTDKLSIRDGGSLQSLTGSSGRGGNLNIKANEIEILGGNTGFILSPSGMESIPFFAGSSIGSLSISSGNAGNIDIRTRRLIIQNGAGIASSGLQSGNSGTIYINASESVQVTGVSSVNPSLNPTRITSSVGTGDPFVTYIYNLTQPPSASSGNVSINTRSLAITDNAQVEVRNNGSGDAGTLQINADQINITNNGGINATTAIAEGGNIGIESNILRLNNGKISATAGQQGSSGNGGNITINADVIAGFNNSSITANAFEGRGGNIRINTQGLFFSPNSVITASSQRGVNGTVEINPRTQPEPTKAPPELSFQTPEIASVCQGRTSQNISPNELVITGTSGLPQGFNNIPNSNLNWQDNSIPVALTSNLENSKLPKNQETAKITPAQGWRFNADGTVTLTEKPNTINPETSLFSNPCSWEPSATKPIDNFDIKS